MEPFRKNFGLRNGDIPKSNGNTVPVVPSNDNSDRLRYVNTDRRNASNVSETFPIHDEGSFENLDSPNSPLLFDDNENVETNRPSSTVENNMDDDDLDDTIADGVDENFLSSINDEKKESVIYNHQMEEKRDYLRGKLNRSKKFYFEYNDQLNLNRQSFLRYSGIPTFDVGYAWKNRVDRMDKVELMTQLVNELNQIKNCCLQLYYRESSVSVNKTKRLKLVEKYIGKTHEKEFKTAIEKEVKEYVWFLNVYKKRYLDVKKRLIRILGVDEEFIKSIKNYDDVYDYFIYHLDIKEIVKNLNM